MHEEINGWMDECVVWVYFSLPLMRERKKEIQNW
jgi:hypothetical protein